VDEATFWRSVVERQVRSFVRGVSVMGRPAYESDEQRDGAVTEIMRLYEKERDEQT